MKQKSSAAWHGQLGTCGVAAAEAEQGLQQGTAEPPLAAPWQARRMPAASNSQQHNLSAVRPAWELSAFIAPWKSLTPQPKV